MRTGRIRATEPDPLGRCVGDPTRFAAETWGRRPRVHRGGDALEDVLTLDDVDALLSSAARRPEVRVMREGRPVDAASWTGRVRLGGRWLEDVIDPVTIGRCLHEGATIVLQSLHRTVPSVSRFVAALERQVSHPVQVNAYLTPPGSAGLSAHADDHDVIAVQLHGEKRWWVDGLGDVVLAAGQSLYLPVGTRHSAATAERSSLHLTIGIARVTYRAALQRLLRREAPELDRPLPLGYAVPGAGVDDVLAAGLGDARHSAAKALVDADPCELARHERERRRPRVRHDGHIASVVALDDLGPDTVVALRDGSPPDVTTESDGRVRVDLGHQVLHLPAGARAAVDRLLQGGGCRVGDLPELTPVSRLVVARRLVVEGMLVLPR